MALGPRRRWRVLLRLGVGRGPNNLNGAPPNTFNRRPSVGRDHGKGQFRQLRVSGCSAHDELALETRDDNVTAVGEALDAVALIHVPKFYSDVALRSHVEARLRGALREEVWDTEAIDHFTIPLLNILTASGLRSTYSPNFSPVPNPGQERSWLIPPLAWCASNSERDTRDRTIPLSAPSPSLRTLVGPMAFLAAAGSVVTQVGVFSGSSPCFMI